MAIVPLAPVTPTHLLCLGCGGEMRREVEKYRKAVQNRQIAKIVFYCDVCQYGHEPSMIHASGQTVKYLPPPTADPAEVDIQDSKSALEQAEEKEKQEKEKVAGNAK